MAEPRQSDNFLLCPGSLKCFLPGPSNYPPKMGGGGLVLGVGFGGRGGGLGEVLGGGFRGEPEISGWGGGSPSFQKGRLRLQIKGLVEHS